jgi:hypothetical protein
VQTSVAPTGILLRQTQDQEADGSQRARPARTLGSGGGRVSAGGEVAVPAQDSVGAYEEPQPMEDILRQPMEQGRQQRSVAGVEPRPLGTELALRYRDLVAEDDDLGVLVAFTHRHESQEREGVCHAEVRRS